MGVLHARGVTRKRSPDSLPDDHKVAAGVAGRAEPILTSVSLPPATAVRLRRLARRLHGLGERPIYELLAEIVQGADIMVRLERYAALDPDTVRALGGDELPNQLFVIEGKPR
jgi:hypothetical protein